MNVAVATTPLFIVAVLLARKANEEARATGLIYHTTYRTTVG